MRLAILLHRYLGIAVGFVVSLWCVSAFVMMYVQYPAFTDAERVVALEPLDLSRCCAPVLTGKEPGPAPDSPLVRPSLPPGHTGAPGAAPPRLGSEGLLPEGSLDRFRIEMLGTTPVLRLFGSWGQKVIDLGRGRPVAGVSAETAEAVSRAFARRMSIGGEITALGTVPRDQWTVYASYDAHRPLYHFAADDPAGSEWYVSGPSGEVVQITTAAERFWNWIGAVTHWIYFTSLRQHTLMWSQTVIWLTIVSAFLTTLGVYIGIKRLKRRRNARLSPYRGWMLWHHYTGLVFGAFVLTWLVSGFFSMNPFGMLEGRSFAGERERLRGAALDEAEVVGAVRAMSARPLPGGTVRVDASIVDGELSLIAWDRDGRRTRLDAASLAPRPLKEEAFSVAAGRLRPGVDVAEQGWLFEDDAYYYGHHTESELPVYRVRYADGELFYLDAVTGELVHAADAERRKYRWLFAALHRGDFSKLLRSRPIWDALMLPLLLGVTLAAVTGTWLGFRRLAR